MNATNVQSLATLARSYFTVKTPAGWDCYHPAPARPARFAFPIKTRAQSDYDRLDLATAPEWVRHLVDLAHGSMLTDEYKSRFVLDALKLIADNPTANPTHVEVDRYIGDLLTWVSSHADRVGYCDRYLEETGSNGLSFSTAGLLAWGQIIERREVFSIVRRALEAQLALQAVVVAV